MSWFVIWIAHINIGFFSRKLKAIKLDDFKSDIKQATKHSIQINKLDVVVDYYNNELKNILDIHAPMQSRTVSLRNPTPWSSEDIKPEKLKRRRLERKWRRSRLQVDHDCFKSQKNRVNAMLNAFKIKFYSNLVKKNFNNPRALFKIINRALHRKEDTSIPFHVSEIDVANEFSTFFKDKIQSIHDYLDNPQLSSMPDDQSHDQPKYISLLTEFKSLNEDEVKKLILKSPNKHCELDPIPTTLLHEILPLLTKIINLSLHLGDIPNSLQKAIIKPLLKKLGLELINKNYRPVSNLTFLSKIIERAKAKQLIDHLTNNNLMDNLQSAYREGHSTGTALLRVQNDILMEVDKGNVVINY